MQCTCYYYCIFLQYSQSGKNITVNYITKIFQIFYLDYENKL